MDLSVSSGYLTAATTAWKGKNVAVIEVEGRRGRIELTDRNPLTRLYFPYS